MVGSQIALPPRDPQALPKAKSSLVRRLVAASNDPAKQRIRAWLANLGDEQLSNLGLTPPDIVILRGEQQVHRLAGERQARPQPARAARPASGHRNPVRSAPGRPALARSGRLQKL